MLTIPKIREVVSRVGKKYGIKNAFLFGSYANNSATDNSDVDLIIEKGDVRTYKQFFHLCEELESELGTEVDLLTKESVRPRFFDSIKDERIQLYG